MYHIYILKDLDGRVKYVGQTQQIEVRKRDHKRLKPPHTFEVLFETFSPDIAKIVEIENISKYDTFKNGWNKTTGGEGFDDYIRSGIGGVKKGNIPWNKGMKDCFTKDTIEKMKLSRKGRVFSRKITDNQIKEIRTLYEKKPYIEDVGKIMKNGKKMSYVQAFCRQYSENYNITLQGMKKIILKECWKNV